MTALSRTVSIACILSTVLLAIATFGESFAETERGTGFWVISAGLALFVVAFLWFVSSKHNK
jgi:hypothetical protein